MIPPIYVISLSRCTERRRKLEKRFEGLELRFDFFDAVDGYALTPSYSSLLDEQGMLRELGRPMTPGEIGCALSHAMLYRYFLDSEMEDMVVLEDDVIPTSDFAAILPQLRGTEENMILLYHDKTRVRTGWRFRSKRLTDYYLASPAISPNCTAAYWVRRQAIEVLLDAALPLRYVSDWPLSIEKKLNAKAIVPRLVERDQTLPSTIGARPPVLTARKRKLPNILRRWSSTEIVPR